MNNKEYINIVTVSHFRHSYVIPLKDLEEFRKSESESQADIAQRLIQDEDVKEFSQTHISEDVVATKELSAIEFLDLIDDDPNCHMKSWSTASKINYAEYWGENF